MLTLFFAWDGSTQTLRDRRPILFRPPGYSYHSHDTLPSRQSVVRVALPSRQRALTSLFGASVEVQLLLDRVWMMLFSCCACCILLCRVACASRLPIPLLAGLCSVSMPCNRAPDCYSSGFHSKTGCPTCFVMRSSAFIGTLGPFKASASPEYFGACCGGGGAVW